MEPIEGSETSAFKPQTPGKYPKVNILHKEGGVFVEYSNVFALKPLRAICRVVPLYEIARFSPFRASKVTAKISHSTFEGIKKSCEDSISITMVRRVGTACGAICIVWAKIGFRACWECRELVNR